MKHKPIYQSPPLPHRGRWFVYELKTSYGIYNCNGAKIAEIPRNTCTDNERPLLFAHLCCDAIADNQRYSW